MKTRIKKINATINEQRQERFCVQELGNDGVFRTIDGGVCYTKEGAEKVRRAYKLTAKRVQQFNAKFQHQVLKFPVDYEKCRDK